MKLFFLISFLFIFSIDVSSKDHKDTHEIIKNSIENKFRNKENIGLTKSLNILIKLNKYREYKYYPF